MIGMIFKFDEAKIRAEGKYTVKELYDAVDRVAARSYLTKEEPGHYIGNMGEHSFALVGRTILALEKEPWFINNLSEWLYYNGDSMEDVIAKHRERYHGKSEEYNMV